MAIYLLEIEYDGRPFCGWQYQKESISVQGIVQQALEQLTQSQTMIYGAGRTDKGVHAYGQCAHFHSTKDLPLRSWHRGLNFYLKDWPIRILNVYPMTENFHARFSAQSRCYVYKILPRSTALDRFRAWSVEYNIHCDWLRQALELFIGTHNFSNFRSRDCQSASPIKTIDFCQLRTFHGQIYIFFQARSFLHHQVRMIVGACMEVARGRWNLDKIQSLLYHPHPYKKSVTAPAHGLYFLGAVYPRSAFLEDTYFDPWKAYRDNNHVSSPGQNTPFSLE